MKNREYELLIAVLDRIAREYERLYWNKYQEPAASPFLNAGEEYKNDVFAVNAYDWTEESDEAPIPNFNYKNGEFRLTWYKHSHRDLTCKTEQRLTPDYLATMLEDCLSAMYHDPYLAEEGGGA